MDSSHIYEILGCDPSTVEEVLLNCRKNPPR